MMDVLSRKSTDSVFSDYTEFPAGPSRPNVRSFAAKFLARQASPKGGRKICRMAQVAIYAASEYSLYIWLVEYLSRAWSARVCPERQVWFWWLCDLRNRNGRCKSHSCDSANETVPLTITLICIRCDRHTPKPMPHRGHSAADGRPCGRGPGDGREARQVLFIFFFDKEDSQTQAMKGVFEPRCRR